jgi:hypothetical protein
VPTRFRVVSQSAKREQASQPHRLTEGHHLSQPISHPPIPERRPFPFPTYNTEPRPRGIPSLGPCIRIQGEGGKYGIHISRRCTARPAPAIDILARAGASFAAFCFPPFFLRFLTHQRLLTGYRNFALDIITLTSSIPRDLVHAQSINTPVRSPTRPDNRRMATESPKQRSDEATLTSATELVSFPPFLLPWLPSCALSLTAGPRAPPTDHQHQHRLEKCRPQPTACKRRCSCFRRGRV